MKKILCIVRTYCAPDVRVEKITKSLTEYDYDVTTFCLWDKSLPRQQVWDGGKIERIVHSPIKNKSMVNKVFSIFYFFFITLFKGRLFDAVHCNDLDMLPIGVFLKWLSFGRIKVIYDAHEYETERFHHDGLVKNIAKIVERLFIKHADAVITVSDAIADEYVRLYDIEKPTVLLNCPFFKKVNQSNVLRDNLNISDEGILFLYQGGLFPNRGIEMIVEAFEAVTDHKKNIVFMGFGQLEGYIKEKAEECPHIHFHEAVSTDILHDYTSSADVGILYYENTCLNHYYCSPNKLFEYIMAGLPIIASNLYEMKRIITKNDIGFVTEDNNAQSLQKVVEGYDVTAIEKQRNGVHVLRDVYNWDAQKDYLLKTYGDII